MAEVSTGWYLFEGSSTALSGRCLSRSLSELRVISSLILDSDADLFRRPSNSLYQLLVVRRNFLSPISLYSQT